MSKYKRNTETHVWHLPYLSHTRDAAELSAWKGKMSLLQQQHNSNVCQYTKIWPTIANSSLNTGS